MAKKHLLMIKTKDKRQFFTHQKNMPLLLEFAKTFNAELIIVSSNQVPVLELDKLALAICDSNYIVEGDFKIISKIYPKQDDQKQRNELIENANIIKSYIRNKISKQKSISLKDLKKEFSHLKVTDSCFCHHIKVVREELKLKGVEVVKTGAGQYAIK